MLDDSQDSLGGAGRAMTNGGPARGYGWPTAIALAAAVLVVYGLVATCSTLFDRDEPRFAAAAVEMVQSGNYLYPTFNGKLRPDKPIMVYWLMSVPVRLFGPTEFAVRSFSVLATAVSCVLLYLIGRRMFSSRVGVWAIVVAVSTPLTVVVGTAATSDAVLLAMMMGAFVSFALWVGGNRSKWRTVLLALALAGALLTKGPVGLAVPLLAVLAMAWLGRRGGFPTGGRFWLGVAVAAVVGLGVFLAWAIPANMATGGEFAREGLGRHVVSRMHQPQEGHGGNFFLTLPFYFVVVLVGFFPWTLYLPAGLSATLGGRLGGAKGRAFLLGWIVPTFVLMTLLATKLPHYILGIWPALALVVAATIDAAANGSLDKRDRRWLRAGVWFFAPVGVAVGAALVVVPLFLPLLAPLPDLRLPCAVAGVIVLVATVLTLRHHVAGRTTAGARVAFAACVLLMLTASFGVLPAFERYKPVSAIADAIRQRTTDDVPVWTCRFGEPSFDFYLRRPPIGHLAANGELATWARQDSPGVLVVARSGLDEVEAEYGKLPLQQIATGEGFNYSNGRWMDLVVLGRGLPDLHE